MTENDFKGFGKKLEQEMKPALKMIEDLAKEVMKVNTPLGRKTIDINGESCIVSILEDGRIILNFPSIKSAQKYFDKPDAGQSEAYQQGAKAAYDEWLSASWYKRIFKK